MDFSSVAISVLLLKDGAKQRRIDEMALDVAENDAVTRRNDGLLASRKIFLVTVEGRLIAGDRTRNGPHGR